MQEVSFFSRYSFFSPPTVKQKIKGWKRKVGGSIIETLLAPWCLQKVSGQGTSDGSHVAETCMFPQGKRRPKAPILAHELHGARKLPLGFSPKQ